MKLSLMFVCLVSVAAGGADEDLGGSYEDSGGSYEDSGGSYVEPDGLPAYVASCPAMQKVMMTYLAAGKSLDDLEKTPADKASVCTEWNGNQKCHDATKGDDYEGFKAKCARKKPAYDKAAFAENLKNYKVVESIADVTLPPTKAPTPAPVPEGMYAKTEEVEKQAVEAKMKFPFKGDEVRNSPAVQGALTDGMAAAIGVKKENVQIGAVDGKKLGEGRRLAEAEITFIIIADNAADLEALSKDIVAAAAEGSIVANVQKAAATNGVLTAGLKAMTQSVTIETPTTTTVKVTVVTIVEGEAPTQAPTKVPTKAPTEAPKPDNNLNGAGAVGISHLCMMVAIVQAITFALM